MPDKKPRPPWGSLLILAVLSLIGVCGLFRSDELVRTSLTADREPIIATSISVRSSQLGFSFVHKETLYQWRDAQKILDAAGATALGWRWIVQPLPENASLLRRFGIGFTRTIDPRPQSFQNDYEVTIPVWLLIALFAIAPARYWRKRRRAIAPDKLSHSEGTWMRKGIILGIACGVVVGAIAMLVILKGRRFSATGTASLERVAEPAPIHPIVGIWKMHLGGVIDTTYRFNNDGSFALSFKSPLDTPPRFATLHEAGGTWKVNGDTLVMRNTMSTSPLTVVGEEETAKILSIIGDTMVLENIGSKGKREEISFRRYERFVSGKIDKLELVGFWVTPQTPGAPINGNSMMELQASGEVIFNGDATLTGNWSQTGKTFRLMVNPAPVRAAARRPAQPKPVEPTELISEVRIAADGDSFVLRRADIPNAAPISYRRATESEKQQILLRANNRGQRN